MFRAVSTTSLLGLAMTINAVALAQAPVSESRAVADEKSDGSNGQIGTEDQYEDVDVDVFEEMHAKDNESSPGLG